MDQKQITHHDRIREVLEPRLLSFAEQVNFAMASSFHPFLYEHIKEYSSRSLSWDLDALKAFKGIITSWDEYTYWGISFTDPFPRGKILIDTLESAFAQSLAWIGTRHPPGGSATRRCKDFPTWSWISLSNNAWVDSLLLDIFPQATLIPCCEIPILWHSDDQKLILPLFYSHK